MSETGEQADFTEMAHRYAGAVAADQQPASAHHELDTAHDTRTAADWEPEERDYHRKVFGVTYRERYGKPSAQCVTYCLDPGQRRRGARCPACYGTVAVRPMNDAEIDPEPSRAERLAAWVGGWTGAFIDAMMFPFRVGRAHTEALVRDLMREAMTDSLSDILTVLEGIEEESRAIRNAAELAGERASG